MRLNRGQYLSGRSQETIGLLTMVLTLEVGASLMMSSGYEVYNRIPVFILNLIYERNSLQTETFSTIDP